MTLWSRVIESREVWKVLYNGKRVVRKMIERIVIALVEKRWKKMILQVVVLSYNKDARNRLC